MCYAKHLAFINLLLMSCMTYLHLYVFVSVMLSVKTCLYRFRLGMRFTGQPSSIVELSLCAGSS
jgi:hypothetical protein